MKYSRISIALLLAACAGCTNEFAVPGPVLRECTVTVGTETRTSLSGGSVIWNAGDCISIFDGADNNKFVTEGSGTSASFTGPCAGEMKFALYPYSESARLDGNAVLTEIPALQAPGTGNFASGANVSLGVAPADGCIMQNAGACIKFSVIDRGACLSSVTVTANGGEKLAGPVSITHDGSAPVAAAMSSAVSSITFSSASTIAPGEYCLIAIPGTLSDGITVSFTSITGKTAKRVSHNELILKRNEIISLGGFDLDAMWDVDEEPDDSSADPVSSYGLDYSRLVTMGHPRLMMTTSDFARLRERIAADNQDDMLVRMHKCVMTFADKQLADDSEIIYQLSASDKLLDVSRLALSRLFGCSYAYRATGDERYLTKARTDLATVCAFSSWHPGHYLDVAEMALGVAIAYDWLYHDLTLAERMAARRALSEYALGTCIGQSWVGWDNNWNQVCNAGITAAAIAVYEKDKARSAKAIEQSVPSNIRAMKAIYGDDGNTYEGYSYWGYGTQFEEIYLESLITAFGHCCGIDSCCGGFAKTGRFMLFMYGISNPFNFADGATTGANEVGQWWLAGHFNQPENLAREVYFYNTGKYNSLTNRVSPMVAVSLAKYPGMTNPSGVFPAEKMWQGGGECPVAMIRDGWKYDAGDFYLAIKGGRASSNHGHMDAGSFTLESNGVRWVDDFAAGSYTTYETSIPNGEFWLMSQRSLRWDVLQMNNLFHSTLSFLNSDGSVKNKVHASDHNVDGRALITASSDTDTDRGVTLDMSPVFTDQVASAFRKFSYDGNDLYVTDKITAKPGMAAEMVWNVVTKTSVTAFADGLEMSGSGRKLYVTVESSMPGVAPVFRTWPNTRPEGWTARSWDKPTADVKRAGYTLTIPAGASVTLTTKLSTLKKGDIPVNPGMENPGTDDREDAQW